MLKGWLRRILHVMDNSLINTGLILILMGFIGVVLPLFHISEFFKDIQGLSGLITAFGVLLIPVGLFKDGIPVFTSRGKAIVGIGLLTIIAELVAIYLS